MGNDINNYPKTNAGKLYNLESDFFDPASEQDRIGLDLNDVSEYDLIGNKGHHQVLGHHSKRFIRLYKGYFNELLKRIKKDYPSHYYVTYLNEHDIYYNNVCPNNISVLLKQMNANGGREYLHDDKQIYNEKLVSRILNLFQCKTVFNEILFSGDNEYVLSVDFIKTNETYYPLNTLDSYGKLNVFGDIKSLMNSIDDRFKLLLSLIQDEKGRPEIYADVNAIKSEFLYIYLVQAMLLGDADFNDKNIGLIYDDKNHYVKLGPTLDFEYCFINSNCLGLKEALEFAKNEYPKVYEKFILNVKAFSRKNFFTKKYNYEKFIGNYIEDEKVANEYIEFLQKTINHVNSVNCEICEKEKQ